eukprot:CAMPEP_0117595384 /NCGR_PEP_ID=MMETSP0784-20121206/73730_1 /TAXON_ID=39447 /ORGANISM="" /LENGTH=58 /DNA_ID=CAMNT_0005397555 /DNA_START=466 /DNA_END=642 /DNA_ORIENTATION=+
MSGDAKLDVLAEVANRNLAYVYLQLHGHAIVHQTSYGHHGELPDQTSNREAQMIPKSH